MTEYFPIRRSERKPKAEILKEQMEHIEARLLTNDDVGLGIEVAIIENKGRGIKVRFGGLHKEWLEVFVSGCERFLQRRVCS